MKQQKYKETESDYPQAEEMDTLEDLQDDKLIEWEHFHSSNNEKQDGHLSVRKNVILERTKFNQRHQEAGETADDFITALHCLSEHCGYGALLSEMIRDRLVAGLRDRRLSKQLQMDPELTLDKAVTVISQTELVEKQQNLLENTFIAASSAANVDCVLSQQGTFSKVRESRRQQSKIRATVPGKRTPSHSKTMLEKEEELLDTDDSDDWIEGFSPGGEKPHYCSDCSKSFKKLRDLLRHQRSHTGEKPHHCPVCDKSFAQLDQLKLHKKIHIKEEDNVTQNHQTELNVDRVHPPQRTASKGRGRQMSNMRAGTPGKMGQSQTGKDLSCKSSVRKNQHSEKLQLPQKTQENEEDPENTSDDWTESFRTVEKPYICFDCGKSFKHESFLIRHQRTHTGEKPYDCPDCDKSFARLDTLKLHQKIHIIEEDNVTQNHQTKLNVDRVHTPQRTASKGRGRQKSNMRAGTPGKMGQLQPGKDLPCKSSVRKNQHSEKLQLPQKPPKTQENDEDPENNSDDWTESVSTVEKPYICSDCGKSFKRESCLIRHQRTHTGEKPHHCPDCDKSFARLDNLKLHQKIHIIEEDNVTQNHQTELNVDRVHTLQRTASRGRQKSNMRARTPGGKIVQSQPGKDSPYKNSVRKIQHSEKLQLPQKMQENEEDPENTSDDWTESFSTVEKPYICSDCSKSFKHESFLIRHQRTHTGEKPYDCPDCDKSFARLDNLKLHQKTHMKEERNFHCSDCVKSFVRLAQLEKHQLTHRKSLERHRGTHLSKRQKCLCTICGKECRHMKTHMRVHTGETPYHCTECGKSFPYTNSYQRHILTHNTSGERATYPCLECGKTFTRRDDMVRHVRRIHTGERNHQCRDCGKQFFRKVTLKRHMLVHTGEKPYQCSVCGQRFSQDGDRKRHEKRHYSGLSDFLDL